MPQRRRVALVGATTLLAGAVVAGTVVWFATRPPEPVPPRVSRLPLAPSGAAALTINGNDRDLAITPDGSRVVYVGNRGTQLFVRALDALEPVAVFTGAPRGPFVSPDGQWIGFVDSATTLKKVAVTGGPAVTLATIDAHALAAPPGDRMTRSSSRPLTDSATGLQRVAAAGGPTTVLTRPDRAQGEGDHLWPELLPGGRAVLFTITALTGGLDAAQVAVLDLQTGTRTILVRGGSHAHYVPSGRGSPKRDEREGGHLVYAAAGTLRAVPFDLARLQTRGTPVPVIPDVVTTTNGGVDAVVAGDGTLAYVSGGVARVRSARSCGWTARAARRRSRRRRARILHPRLSPDGTRVAVNTSDQEQDLWIWDLGRTTLTRATFDPASDAFPVWTPDGRRVIFTSASGGRTESLLAGGRRHRRRRAADRESQPAVRHGHFTRWATADLHRDRLRQTGEDVMQMALDGTHRVTPLVQSPFAERNGIVSPDGRWLAYEANDSGRFEIYVRPFPEVNTRSLAGIHHRRHAAALGAERAGVVLCLADGSAHASGGRARPVVGGDDADAAGQGRLLHGSRYHCRRTYDVSSDGQRFLMIKEGGVADQTAAPPQTHRRAAPRRGTETPRADQVGDRALVPGSETAH